MKQNVGELDKTFRIVAGLVLIVIGISIIKPAILMAGFVGVGGILLLTGLFRFCALYSICRMSTCAVKESEQKR